MYIRAYICKLTESLIDTARVQIVWSSHMSTIKLGPLTLAQLQMHMHAYICELT